MAALYVLWQARFKEEVVVYPQVTLPFKPEDAKAREAMMSNASELKIKSRDEKKEWSTASRKLDRVVKILVLYIKNKVLAE